jgi:hypothetical protein
MLWYTGASVKTVYAQTHRVRKLKYPDWLDNVPV